MTITYNNAYELNNIYLHDFRISNFEYNEYDKSINMILFSDYEKKQYKFTFMSIVFCELTGIEKLGDSVDIIDWYSIKESEKFMNINGTKMVGLEIIKASMDTVKIICETIEMEESRTA